MNIFCSKRKKIKMRLKGYENKKAEEYRRPPPDLSVGRWLVICHGRNMQKQTFYSMSEGRYYVRSIAEVENKRVCSCAYGWLVLLDLYSGECCLWNPISMDKIQLPALPADSLGDMECLGLSAPPHDPECCILFLNQNTDLSKPLPGVYFYKPGGGQDYFCKQDLQPLTIESNILDAWTVFKGKFYGMNLYESIIVTLDVDHECGRVQVTPLIVINRPLADHEEFREMRGRIGYLIQSSCDGNGNDALLYVCKVYFQGHSFPEVYSFLVYRFDFIQKEWVEVKSIGDTAILIGDEASGEGKTCSTRGTNLERESVYFIEDRCLCVFNLQTQSLSVSLPCPHVKRNFKSRYSPFHWLC